MPIQVSYPGVYVEEIASGVRSITGVSTSIAAFVGRAKKGPINEPITVFNVGDYGRTFGGLWEKSPMSFMVRDFFLNGGSEAVIVRLEEGATLAETALSIDSETQDLILQAANPGTWGEDISITVDHNTRKPEESESLFNLTIQEAGGRTEPFLNMSLDSNHPNYLVNILAQRSQLIRVKTEDESGMLILPKTRPELTLDSEDNEKLKGVNLENGDDGEHLKAKNFIDLENKAKKTGLYALEKTNAFNLLCIPPYQADSEEVKAVDVETGVIDAAIKYCEDRRALFLVDPKSTWDSMATAIEDFSKESENYPATTSNHAALFFPKLRQKNPLTGHQETFPPSGAIAGIFARTDAQRGVWKTPAGIDATLSGVDGFSVHLTDKENGKLNQMGINCLRSFPIYGKVVWGGRTLAGADQLASEWKYIAVRRTTLFIEESLYRGLKWVIFEPNDEPLWSQIRLNVGAFMNNLFRQGAFQGKKKEAYFVKCDRETTTPNDINNGIVNVTVGFAPLKPAEFVIIQLQQMVGQIEV